MSGSIYKTEAFTSYHVSLTFLNYKANNLYLYIVYIIYIIHTYVCICICMYIYMYACVCVCARACVRACMRVWTDKKEKFTVCCVQNTNYTIIPRDKGGNEYICTSRRAFRLHFLINCISMWSIYIITKLS